MSGRSFLAPRYAPPVPPEPPRPELALFLESLDGFTRIALDGSTGFSHMPGSTGLEMAPVNVVTEGAPGISGTFLRDARVDERRIFIPIFIGNGSGAQEEHLQRMDDLRSVIDPLSGEFRIVGISRRGARELTATYTGGLEGDDDQNLNGLVWGKVGLQAVATQPFAQAPDDRALEFQVAGSDGFLIGAVGGTDAPWPTALSAGTVIGSGMQVIIAGELPVYPTLELTGPMTSFTGSMSTLPSGATWNVSVPAGVAAGKTLKIVTDPRRRSIRLDGALAAGSVSRGSALRPFLPGSNELNVTAPGGTDATKIRITWRELYRSLW